MRRSIRIGLFALLLVGVVGGSALAARGPHADGVPFFADASEAPEALATADALSRAIDRLEAHGVSTDASELLALAEKYGLGGAIRLLAWSESTGKAVAELSAMRDTGEGWGQIGRELGVSPGIGWIMGNGHAGEHGKPVAPGQLKDHAADADEPSEESSGE